MPRLFGVDSGIRSDYSLVLYVCAGYFDIVPIFVLWYHKPISTTLEKLKKEYVPLGVALFLAVGGVVSLPLWARGSNGKTIGLSRLALVQSAYGAQSSHPINDLAGGQAPQDSVSLVSPDYAGGVINYIAQEEGAAFDQTAGAVKDPGGVFANSTSKSGIIEYTVQASDTLPSIAQYFGISVDTITSANPKTQKGSVKTGEILKILPVSGVLYTTQTGDTLGTIAMTFGVPLDQIVQANPEAGLSSVSEITFLNPGMSLIIPGGKAPVSTARAGGN